MDCPKISGWILLSVSRLIIVCAASPPVVTSLCRESPDPVNDNGQVVPAGGADCQFRDTLCSYTQGCKDPEMTNWTASNNGTRSHQWQAGKGANSFSVLESPPLNLENMACVEFRYVSHKPTDLDLYGGVNETSNILLLPGPREENANGRTVYVTAPKDTTKLKFRAYGGGAGESSPLELQYVRIQAGSCQGPECLFITNDTGENRPTLCGWETSDWETRPLQIPGVQAYGAFLKNLSFAGTLTTGLVKATTERAMCVQFVYTMDGINDTLSVIMRQLDGKRTLLWAYLKREEIRENKTERIKLKVTSPTAFQLVFSAERCNNFRSNIGIFSVSSLEHSSQNCSSPPSSAIEVSLSAGCRPVTTVTPQNGGSSLAAIVGSVAGVVVLTAVVIIAVLLWRKRKSERGEKEILNSRNSHQDASANENQGLPSADVYPAVRNPTYLPASDDYSEVNAAHGRPVNPYDLASPLPPALDVIDDYNHPNIQGTVSSRSALQDDYNHLGDLTSTQQNTSDAHWKAKKKKKSASTASQPEDEYHRTDRTKKGPQKQREDTPDLYNHPGGVSSPIGKGHEAEDEYNRVDLKEQGHRRRDATPGTYDHLGREATSSNAKNIGAEVAKHSMQEQDAELYNTLNFDRKEVCDPEQKIRKGPGKAYDHVEGDFQDTYDKPHGDRKEKVIDSEYGHVTQVGLSGK